MSGQGWDETGTLQNPKWRKLFAPFQRVPGVEGRDRSCTKVLTITHPAPTPSIKRRKSPIT